MDGLVIQSKLERNLDKGASSLIIADREISENVAPLVIPEIGINHEGSFEKAIEMVDACKAAGAECVKFQCHITEAEMVPTEMTPGNISKEKLWDIIKRCELNEEEERSLVKYCAEKDLIYLSTPFSREAADRLQDYGVPAFKIGSGECNNLPLIRHIAKFGKPILLSTGMNDLESVRQSVAVIVESRCPFMLFHCTSLYPTPYHHVRLGAIQQLRDEFGCLVGFSDHSLGIYASLGAVALGASVIEKHFTICRSWPGPDTSMSIEPDELKMLVAGSRIVFDSLGGSKTVLDEEKPVIDFAYASVVAIKEIKADEKFSTDNVWVKRPGTGELPASQLTRVIGFQAQVDIPCDSQLKVSDIRDFN